MQKRNLKALRRCLPIGLGLALGVVACGGSDSGSSSNTGGTSATASGGSSPTAGSSSSTAGGTSKAGSSSGTAGSSSGTAGSGTGPTGTFSTGLPADKPVASLTDAEIAGLCSKFDDFYSQGAVGDALKNFDCSLAGFLAAAFAGASTDDAARAACKATHDECVSKPSETTSKCSKPSAACTATVGEVEACANDSAKYVTQLGGIFPSCATLTLADLTDMSSVMAPAEPASCTNLEAKCPDGPTPPSTM